MDLDNPTIYGLETQVSPEFLLNKTQSKSILCINYSIIFYISFPTIL